MILQRKVLISPNYLKLARKYSSLIISYWTPFCPSYAFSFSAASLLYLFSICLIFVEGGGGWNGYCSSNLHMRSESPLPLQIHFHFSDTIFRNHKWIQCSCKVFWMFPLLFNINCLNDTHNAIAFGVVTNKLRPIITYIWREGLILLFFLNIYETH